MARINKDDFLGELNKATYKGGVRGVKGAKDFRRASKQFLRENPSLSNKLKTKGLGKKEYLKAYRKALDLFRDKGIRMRYSKAGGKLTSSQKAKTRKAVYSKLREIDKTSKETPGISKERQRAYNLRSRMQERDEMDAKSGAKREALDTRKKATVSVYKTGKQDKPTVGVNQKKEVPKASVKSLKTPKQSIEAKEVIDPFGDN